MKSLLSLLLCATLANADDPKAVADVSSVRNNLNFGKITSLISLDENIVGQVMFSANTTFDWNDLGEANDYTKGKYAFCFHKNGGVKRNPSILDFGNETTQTCIEYNNTGVDMLTQKLINPGNLVIGGGTTSLVGRSIVMMKRSISVETMTKEGSGTLNVALKHTDSGDTVDSKTAINGKTVFLSFDTNPAMGEYHLEVSGAGSNEPYVIGQLRDRWIGENYWAPFFITSFNATDNCEERRGSTSCTAEAYPELVNKEGSEQSLFFNMTRAWIFPTKAASESPNTTVPLTLLQAAAYGTIGAKNLEAGGQAETEKVRCTFDNSWGTLAIHGSGLITKVKDTGEKLLQITISGLPYCVCDRDPSDRTSCDPTYLASNPTSCQHSFHFHPYGDTSGADGPNEVNPPGLGDINERFKLVPLTTKPGTSVAYYRTIISDTFGTWDLNDIVGQALTVHEGANRTTRTMAWGVCGVAPAKACMMHECDNFPPLDPNIGKHDGVGPTAVLSSMVYGVAALACFLA